MFYKDKITVNIYSKIWFVSSKEETKTKEEEEVELKQ